MFNISRFGAKETPSGGNVLEEIKKRALEKKKLLKRTIEDEPAAEEDDSSDSGIETKRPKQEEVVPVVDSAPIRSDIETPNAEFAILGKVIPQDKPIVQRTLPEWIQKPFIIPEKLSKKIEKNIRKKLNEIIITNLKKMEIKKLFPVQASVIPALLYDIRNGIERTAPPPCDICVSSPTGSGKTLAFAIPIIQGILQSKRPATRAIAILPTKELAVQVYKVFATLAADTSIRVVLLGAGKSFSKERTEIFKVSFSGKISQADIVISTPGKLVDHLQFDETLDLSFLRFLIIDEADRLLDNVKQSWLSVLEKALYERKNSQRTRPGYYTYDSLSTPKIPLQKLLFSATLSADPEKLEILGLFQPRLYSSSGRVENEVVGKPENNIHKNKLKHKNQTAPNSDVIVGKYATPATLTEYKVDCKPNEKPILLIHIMDKKKLTKVLCFTKTVEASHRLYHVLNEYVKIIKADEFYKFTCAEFSSHLSVNERKNVLAKFKNGSINLLVCSNSMARGLDIENVEQVINYDVPKFMQMYVHRVGRTARAGKNGEAYTFVCKTEMFHFKKMISDSGKNALKKFRYNGHQLSKFTENYSTALKTASTFLKDEDKNTTNKNKPKKLNPKLFKHAGK